MTFLVSGFSAASPVTATLTRASASAGRPPHSVPCSAGLHIDASSCSGTRCHAAKADAMKMTASVALAAAGLAALPGLPTVARAICTR